MQPPKVYFEIRGDVRVSVRKERGVRRSSCVPLAVFRGATGSRSSGWRVHQPNGTSLTTTNPIWAFSVGLRRDIPLSYPDHEN